MRDFIEHAAYKELEEFNHIRENLLKIPVEVFREHGCTGFSKVFVQTSIALKIAPSTAQQARLDRAEESLDILRKSCPEMPTQRVIENFSVGYSMLSLLIDLLDAPASDKDDVTLMLTYLRGAAAMKGFVLGALGDSGNAYMEKMRPIFSRNGEKGGKTKNKPTNELKEWALKSASAFNAEREKAGKKWMPPREVTKQLLLQIPAHLQLVSADPERLIYEALLKERRGRLRLP